MGLEGTAELAGRAVSRPAITSCPYCLAVDDRSGLGSAFRIAADRQARVFVGYTRRREQECDDADIIAGRSSDGTHKGMAPFPGSLGQFFWSGMAGTFFWINPAEDMFAVFMMQGPGQRQYIRTLLRDLV